MLKLLVTSFLDIIFPEYCVSCNKKNTLLCQSCFEKLEFTSFEFEHLNNLNNISTLETICSYNQVSKKLITTLKYKGVVKIAKVIAKTIYRSGNIPPANYFIPIPITKRKEKQRGFNQAEEIAKELSKLTHIPYLNLLKKTKETKSQASTFNKKKRKENIKNSFTVNKKLLKTVNTNSNFTIIDDVITTGSTIKECSKVLKKYQLKTINAVTFAQR